jgi:hypothetical protein
MTDFFADLEQELRNAHPRRPRPVVPVRALAVATSVLAAIAAVATFLPAGEREVAQQPPLLSFPAELPVTCGPPPSDDAPVPDVLLQQFAVLRSGAPPAEPLDLEKSGSVLAVYERGVRVVDAGDFGKIAIIPVSLPCAKGKGSPGMCTARLRDGRSLGLNCGGGGRTWNRDFAMASADDFADGEITKVIVLASDSAVGRVEIGRERAEGVDRRPADNLVLARRSGGDFALGFGEPAPESGGCGTKTMTGPGPQAIRDRFAVLRKPGDTGQWKGDVPASVARTYPDGGRAVGDPNGDYAAVFLPVEFPVDGNCDELKPGICLLARKGALEACGVLSEGDEPLVATATQDESGDRRRIFVLAEDGVERLHYESRGARRVESSGEFALDDNWSGFRIGPTKPDEKLQVTPVE